ncbi:MAG: amino acid adenylation domain-containing protein [Myxococcales bacterium FL481]|nr:MAG: amino acid adenylation domain-containing protein [Myxococcales bacterium FL481]
MSRHMGHQSMLPTPLPSSNSAVANPGCTDTKASKESLPLTQRQTFIWLGQQQHPDVPAYNMVMEYGLTGELDVTRFRRAFSAVWQASGDLRSTFFRDSNGTLAQRAGTAEPWSLDFLDLTEVDDPRAAYERIRGERSTQRFRLAERALDAALFQLDRDRYVWWLCQHHIASDAASCAQIFAAVAAAYRDESNGSVEPRPAFATQVQRETAYRASPAFARDEAFWRPRLKITPEPGQFYAYPRVEAAPHTVRESVRLTTEQMRRVNAVVKSPAIRSLFPEMTAAALFQTVLFAYLYRLRGHTPLAIGTPFHNRSTRQARRSLGCFIEVSPIQVDVRSDDSFLSLFHRVHDDTLAVLRHMQHSVGNPIRKPLFDVQYNFLTNEYADFAGHPVDARFSGGLNYYPARGAGFDGGENLNVTVEDYARSGHYTLHFDFRSSRFDSDQRRRSLAHFGRLLDACLDSLDTPIGQVELLGEDEREATVDLYNRTQLDVPHEQTVVDLFRAQVARAPDRVAVQFDDQTLTYADLDARSDRLAGQLAAMGVRPGDMVGVVLERSLELSVALLGILKAGGAYVPMDPHHPPSRNAVIIKDAAAPVIVTQSTRLDCLSPEVSSALLCIDPGAAQATSDRPFVAFDSHGTDPAPPVASRATSTEVAYVIFTSGSSGRPKGVKISHRALTNFLCSIRHEPGVDESTRVGAVTTVSFDMSVLELFLPLTVGARLVIMPRQAQVDPRALAQRLDDYGCNFMQATPTTWRMLLESGWKGSRDFKVLCGGEPLGRPLANRLLERGGELWNMYGPTEATGTSVLHRVERGEGPVLIGHPVANTRAYIVDQYMRLVPLGVPGELLLGGEALAEGYHNRPELTAEKFLPNPFGPGRVYRTGDLARHVPCGAAECLGRIDFQVKVRGFRIELGEIESALESFEPIQGAVVEALADPREPDDKRLVAYLLPRLVDTIDVAPLRKYLRDRLPTYMVPDAFVQLAEFPLTPNGKVDRRALPAPEPTPGTHAPHQGLQGDIERTVAGILGGELHEATVGPDSDFFELGGHSLAAVRALSALHERFGVDLSLRAFMSAPTVRGIVEQLAAGTAGPSTEESSDPAPDAVTRRVPGEPLQLSFAQERLWFLQRLTPESGVYNVPLAFRIRGPLTLTRAQAGLDAILARHEVLRSVVRVNPNGDPAPSVLERWSLPLEFHDLEAAGDGDAAFSARASTMLERPFDLEAHPPLRGALFRDDDNAHRLCLIFHHLVFDGLSVAVFQRELLAALSATTMEAATLDPLPLGFYDYAAHERRHLKAVIEPDLQYWENQLGGTLPALALPLDLPRPAHLSYRGRVHRVRLGRQAYRDLQQLARERGATVYMTLLAGFFALLRRLTDQEQLLVGTPVGGREGAAVQSLIGAFVNTVVVREQVTREVAFDEFVDQVKASCLAAFDHQRAPFERVVARVKPRRDTSRTPIFQAFFSYLESESPRLAHGEHELEVIAVDQPFARTDLSLFTIRDPEGITCEFEYATDLFEHDTIVDFAECFVTMLSEAVSRPQTAIGQLVVLSPQARRRQLVTWNETGSDYESRGVHHRLEQHAREIPNHPAVEFGAASLCFGELNQRANRLAGQLIRAGVTTGCRVAVCMERSLWTPVALLAVMKAGGAYVPLDPSHPVARLQLVLDVAEPQLVLCDAEGRAALPDGHGLPTLAPTEPPSECSDPNPDVGFDPEQVAYVMFTSGSTGTPKGVEIPHRALGNFLAAMSDRPGMRAGQRLLSITPTTFDISGLELFLPLQVGGIVRVADAATGRDPRALIHELETHAVDILQATPATWRMLLDAGWRGCPDLIALSGGEALPQTLAAALIPTVGQLWNLYGPTETTIWSTASRLEDASAPITIGRPIANTRAYVLDDALRPLPRGAVGELYLGGDGLALGYCTRPDLTRERFLPDPFVPDARIYKTGDRARYRADGRLECLGRADQQVKIRGHRIELGEIEAAMRQHPQVTGAVATVFEHPQRGPELAGYVRLKDGSTTAPADLSDSLSRRLPSYMVPHAITAITQFPLTPHGKVDRSALPPPMEVVTTHGTPQGATRDDIDIAVVDAFRHELGVRVDGIDVDFFALGGHSMLAIRLLERIKRVCGAEISLDKFFANPTVRAVADMVKSGGGRPEVAVFPLNGGGKGRPIYFVCGIHLYEALARELEGAHPCYGVFVPAEQGLLYDSAETEVRTDEPLVPRLAAHYLEAIVEHAGEHPFSLAGVSFGGVLAYEVARQSLRTNTPIDRLVLLDARWPAAVRRNHLLWSVGHVRRLLTHGFGDLLSRLRERRHQRKWQQETTTPATEMNDDMQQLDGLRQGAYRRAMIEYQRFDHMYDGRTILVRAKDVELFPGDTYDEQLGWRERLAAEFVTVDVPGSHIGILSHPAVGELADTLRFHLDDTRTRATS